MIDAKTLGNRYLNPVSVEDDREICGNSYGETGITLRQHFAGLAMQGFSANPKAYEMIAEEVAGYAVQYADALLAELAKEPQS